MVKPSYNDKMDEVVKNFEDKGLLKESLALWTWTMSTCHQLWLKIRRCHCTSPGILATAMYRARNWQLRQERLCRRSRAIQPLPSAQGHLRRWILTSHTWSTWTLVCLRRTVKNQHVKETSSLEPTLQEAISRKAQIEEKNPNLETKKLLPMQLVSVPLNLRP